MRRFGQTIEGWVVPVAPNRAVLEGRHARLERLSLAHAEELHAANAADDRIWDYLPYGPFADLAGYRAWIASVADGTDPWFYAIIDKASGKASGVASSLRITSASGSIEVGHINFSAALQRTAAATEAMFLMMEWAFEAGYRRYEWKCDALNLPSRRAAARLGLSYEGVFRQATIYKGRNRDTAWFAAIDKEWPALKAAFDRWLDPGNFDTGGAQRESLADLTRPLLAAADPATG